MASVLALGAGILQFAPAQTVSAEPVSKAISGTCTGADAATNGLLAALGGTSLAVAFKVTGDVPKSLQPGQDDATASFTWAVALDAGLVTKATAAGLKQMTIKNAKLDISVSGPTSTTAIPGRPGPAVLNLVSGTPATLTQGPFTAPLAGIGESGVVNFKTSTVSFTIAVALAGKALDLNIACSAAALVASSPVTVAGAPVIGQPIEARGTAGSAVPVDVFASVTPGRTPVLPSSLRVIDGPAKVVDGKLVVTAGKAGSVTSATFEVCGEPFKVSEAEPGVSEVQRIELDTNIDGFKRAIAFSLTSEGEGDTPEETKPIWAAEIGFFGFLGGLQLGDTFPADWTNQVNNYAFGTGYLAPSAARIQQALELLPSIGTGNVTVVKVATPRPTYDISFTGALAEKDRPEIKVGKYLSVLPQETLESLIALAGAAGGAASAGPTTTIPDGLTAQQYIDRLVQEAGDFIAAGDFNTAGDKFAQAIQLSLTNALANIDVQETVKSITELFPSKPVISTTTPGAEPIAATFQDLCSQGSATVVVAAAPTPTTTTVPGGPTTTVPGGPTTTVAGGPGTTAPVTPTTAPGAAVLAEQSTRTPAQVNSPAAPTGPTSLAVTGNNSSVLLLLASVLLIIAGIVLGDRSRFQASRR